MIIEALCQRPFRKDNLSDSTDTFTLYQLLQSGETALNAKDAGTTFRFLTAYCALKEGEWTLTGTERMQQRPVGDLVQALRSLGAEISFLKNKEFPPIKITGGKLNGDFVKVNAGISSQFVSALLMIAPCLEKGLTVEIEGDIVSEPYITMTLKVMEYFGVVHEWKENKIFVPHQEYITREIFIESDWSAASYFYEMAAFADEVDLEISGLGTDSFQGDAILSSFYRDFGVTTEAKKNKIHLKKISPYGLLDFDLKNFPDLAPAMFTTCGGLSLTGTFSGLSHLQFKESNREEVLRSELAKCGINVNKLDGRLMISGKFIPGKYRFLTYNDHRIAMALAPLAMLSEEVVIENPSVVNKSYPNYWNDLARLGFEINWKQKF